ncbi:MAG TPA: beta-ketoacyl-ACP synthase II [Conexibacter sp.]|nr:beta-ketoacyl-ACP synthase II [Conexibacter sp.]
MRRAVVITGVGAITPLGVGADTLIDRWTAGASGIEDGLGRCAQFDPAQTLTRKQMHRSDRFTQLALAAAAEAIAGAGWADELPYPPERIGCIVGTGIGGVETCMSQQTILDERGADACSPLGIPMMMPNAASGAIAMRYGIAGPNWSVASACAAGAHAIGTAARLVQIGEADAIVTGGAEAAIAPLTIAAFARMLATSRTGVSRPFDARRDGFVLGEGAGVLVLEEAESARARGAEPLGQLLGYAATADAYHLTAPDPTGGGPARAIALALEEARVGAADVDYVNAHGTATLLNDRVETAAIKRVFGDAAAQLPVSSLKSAIGHLLGASGAVEAVATVLALRRRIAPPTLNWAAAEEGLDLDYVPVSAKPLRAAAHARRAVGISNSFGFGGHNAVLCIAA